MTKITKGYAVIIKNKIIATPLDKYHECCLYSIFYTKTEAVLRKNMLCDVFQKDAKIQKVEIKIIN